MGTCEKCASELIIRRGHRGSRFIGCSGYPECRFTLPLPRFGSVVVTDKVCEKHGMNHIRIINKGKRPWDLGCPHCNFLEWQARKAQELADPAKAAEAKAKSSTKRAAAGAKKKAAGAAKAGTGARAKASTPAEGDGLVSVPGIGPKTLEKLSLAGIRSVPDLASARADSLAEKTGISPKKIMAWQSAARAMS